MKTTAKVYPTIAWSRFEHAQSKSINQYTSHNLDNGGDNHNFQINLVYIYDILLYKHDYCKSIPYHSVVTF